MESQPSSNLVPASQLLLDCQRSIAALVRHERLGSREADRVLRTLNREVERAGRLRARALELLYAIAEGIADGTLKGNTHYVRPWEGALAVVLRPAVHELSAQRRFRTEPTDTLKGLVAFARALWTNVVLDASARVLVGDHRCRVLLLGTDALSKLVRIPVPFR